MTRHSSASRKPSGGRDSAGTVNWRKLIEPVTEDEKIISVSPHLVKPLEFQPRSKTKNDERQKKLTASIDQNGQTRPGIVYPIKGDPKYRFGLIAGSRRRFSCIQLNRRFRVVVRDIKDPDMIFWVAFIDNWLQKELSPMDTARSIDRLIKSRKFRTMPRVEFYSMVAQGAGKKTPNWASNMLGLLELPTEIQGMLESDAPRGASLRASTAFTLRRIHDNPDRQIAVAKLIAKDGISFEKARNLVDKTIKNHGLPPPQGGRPRDMFFVFKREVNSMFRRSQEIVSGESFLLDKTLEGRPPGELRELAKTLDATIKDAQSILKVVNEALDS